MGKKKTPTAVAKLDARATRRLYLVLAAVCALDAGCSLGLLGALGCAQGLFALDDCAALEVALSFVRAAALGLLLWGCTRWGQTEHNAGLEGPGPPMSATRRRSTWWRRGSIASAFVLLTAMQVELGLKGTLAPLDGGNQAAVQGLLCVLIMCCNVELFLVRRALDSITADEGIFSRLSHKHRLFPKEGEDIGRSRCDRCHLRVLEAICWNCASCNFDVCLSCLRRDTRKAAEDDDILNDDDDVVVEEDLSLSFSTYARQAGRLVRPHLALVVAALLCVLLRNVAGVLLPNYTGKILDAVIRGSSADFQNALVIFVALNLCLGLLSGCSKLLWSAVFQRLDRGLKTVLFDRFLSQEIEFFDNATTGDLMTKLHDDTKMMLSPVQSYLASTLGFLLSLIGGFIMCVYTSFRLSILAFTVLGPLSMIVYTYSAWASGVNSALRGLTSSMADTAKESFSLIRTIRSFGREEMQRQRYSVYADTKLQVGMKDAFASAGADTLSQYLELALHALVLTYGGLAILTGRDPHLTVGALVTFQLYWSMLSGAFRGLADQLSQFSKASGASQRVIYELQRLPLVDPTQGIAMTGPLGDIMLHDAWFHYSSRPDNTVLKGVSLRIPRGSVCALVGRSGGGKSTIISLLAGHYRPSKGHISVGGTDLSELCLHDYRQRIGVVLQESEMFDESVEHNIAFGVESYTQDDLKEAAQRANCLDFVRSFPDGFATKVGERGVKLSGGQRQRIALARVLMRKPELLLLDEATSALDAESEALVQAALDALMAQDHIRPTIVLVAHRLSTVINADMIAVVDGGRIAELGTHQELLQLGGIYAKLVARQVQKMANSLDGAPTALSVDELYADDTKGKEEFTHPVPK